MDLASFLWVDSGVFPSKCASRWGSDPPPDSGTAHILSETMLHQHICEQATLHHTQKSQAQRLALTQSYSASHRTAPANSMYICSAASCQYFTTLLRVYDSCTEGRCMETLLSYASWAASPNPRIAESLVSRKSVIYFYLDTGTEIIT